jgi:hypothetical protein
MRKSQYVLGTMLLKSIAGKARIEIERRTYS